MGRTESRRHFINEKKEHAHEWVLLTHRVYAYIAILTALLIADGAVVETLKNVDIPARTTIASVCGLGVFLSFLYSLAITINCRILLDLHKSMSALILSDRHGHLRGLYRDRAQPDWMHRVSVDLCYIVPPIVGGVIFALLLRCLLDWTLPYLAAFLTFWIATVSWIYLGANVPKLLRTRNVIPPFDGLPEG